jgi:methionyl-tRNA synthetase
MINYESFSQMELRVATITAAERVEGSEKLIKLQLNLGSPSTSSGQLSGERQIIAGIGKAYEPEQLINTQIIIAANLEPRMFTLRHGSGQVVLESNGMLLAARDESEKPVLLRPERPVPAGSKIN